VTVSVEPTVKQIEPVSAGSVYVTFPDTHVDWVTGGSGEGVPPLDTVKLTGVPFDTDTPADGLEAMTVPAGNRESGIPEIACGERPASLRALVATSRLMPTVFGTTTGAWAIGRRTMGRRTTGCPRDTEVVHAEAASPRHNSASAASRLRRVNPYSCRRSHPSSPTSRPAAVCVPFGRPRAVPASTQQTRDSGM
jgi:hypothetical protein